LPTTGSRQIHLLIKIILIFHKNVNDINFFPVYINKYYQSGVINGKFIGLYQRFDRGNEKQELFIQDNQNLYIKIIRFLKFSQKTKFESIMRISKYLETIAGGFASTQIKMIFYFFFLSRKTAKIIKKNPMEEINNFSVLINNKILV
jgi:hypothetical protein